MNGSDDAFGDLLPAPTSFDDLLLPSPSCCGLQQHKKAGKRCFCPGSISCSLCPRDDKSKINHERSPLLHHFLLQAESTTGSVPSQGQGKAWEREEAGDGETAAISAQI